MKFYLTFGQKSPARNGWCEVFADSPDSARRLVIDEYGQEWAFIYSEEQFAAGREYFPAGKLGELK
jgi:hypothetical protein